MHGAPSNPDMSQYPHPYGYGQYYGQYLQPPYGYPNATGFTAPAPNLPYTPSPSQLNRDISQAAFDSNATAIPGLGIGGTPAGRAQRFVPPAAAAPLSQQPGFAAPKPAAPSSEQTSSSFGLPSSQHGLTAGGPSKNAGPSIQPPPALIRPAANVDTEVEEGELSEGQFEDLYESPDSVPNDTVPSASKAPLTTAGPSQPTSAADTPEGGFYATEEDDSGKGSGSAEGRERSASYSPFLSPREVQSGAPTPRSVADKRESDPAPWSQRGRKQAPLDRPGSDLPGSQPSGGAPPPEHTSSSTSQPAPAAPQPQSAVSTPFKSLQEAKKEARKAILRLWPLGVKYQNYIDEGFDEKVIKGLFQDLHLDIPKTTADTPAAQPRESRPSHEFGGTGPAVPGQSSEMPSQRPAPSSQAASTTKGEERKDRIARLLAAKAAQAAKAPPVPAAPKQPPKPAPQPKQELAAPPALETAPAPPKAKTWGEKERLLQQKIAALQKSREAQAQKSGPTTPDLAAVQNDSTGQPTTQTSSAAPSIPTGPRAAAGVPLPATNVQVQAQDIPPQPRLPVPPPANNAQPGSSNQRKRPVASDFVEYSSGSFPSKRPFGQARDETSFIIDVSDASDDEEMDMDMDMGSPVDETPPPHANGAHGQRGLAIRDFPPLTDTVTQRQISSPAPSITPPRHAPNDKKRKAELDLKEKAIQEMKRKIALAEAKRKAKQSSGGSVTPNPAGTMPDSKENGTVRPTPTTERRESMSSLDRSDGRSTQVSPEPSSMRLPKRSESRSLDPQHRAERRGRILSLEIPRVESSLKEKLSRLQALQDEQARLKAEIDRSLAEKKELDDELQNLDDAPQAQSLQRDGDSSFDTPETTVPSHPGDVGSADGQRQGEASPASPAKTSLGGSTGRPPSVQSSQGGIVEAGSSDELSQAKLAQELEVSNERSTSAASSSSTGDVTDAGAGESSGVVGENVAPPPDSRDDLAVSASSPGLKDSTESNATEVGGLEDGDVGNVDSAALMDVDLRPASPGEAERRPGSLDAKDGQGDSLQSSASLPDQISSVAQPREAEQEIEAEAAAEVRGEPVSKLDSTLKPYESPLRYFRAYRFHPDYRRAVAGGLKSLTYSNRIDPERELCPFELNGEQCPANCEFQHFRSIAPPDDQILLELGNPDEYSGEEKTRFIQGLRELLQKFKADKVKDFDTIARAIIEFRSQVLGDRSKILRLEGVAL